MGDVFKEQIVKRQSTSKDMAIRVCLFVAVFMLGFVAILFAGGAVGVIVMFAGGFGAFYLMGFLNVEYEYVFTNGELDIDVIYDRSRRKRVFSANVKDFEIMAHVEDRTHEHSFSAVQEVLDYSSGIVGLESYAFIATQKGKKSKIIIEPNEKMLKAISGVLTRRKFHPRPGVVLTP